MKLIIRDGRDNSFHDVDLWVKGGNGYQRVGGRIFILHELKQYGDFYFHVCVDIPYPDNPHDEVDEVRVSVGLVGGNDETYEHIQNKLGIEVIVTDPENLRDAALDSLRAYYGHLSIDLWDGKRCTSI